MRKKLLIVMLSILVLAAALAGCNNNKTTKPEITYNDIFVSHDGITEYSSAQLAAELPSGVSPYTGTGNTADYEKAYIDGYHLLICYKSFVPEGETAAKKLYGVYAIDEKKFIGGGVVYSQFGYGRGFVFFADSDGKCSVYNYKGECLISADDGITLASRGETSVSNAFIALSDDYFVVRHDNKTYTSSLYLYDVYKADGTPVKTEEGVQFSVKSKFYGKSNALVFGLKAVDDYIVSNEYTGTYTVKKSAVYYYDVKTGEQIYDVFKERGSYDSSKQTREAFYLGDGKLYCYQQETSTKDDGYTYSVGEKYYKILVWTYDLLTGKKTLQSPDLIYSSIINKYNADETTISSIDNYLKEGYSLGNLVYIRNADKTVNNDQFVIDSNLKVYLSFYTHDGISTIYSDLNDDARDVLLTFVDGIGVSSSATDSDLMVYDGDGNTILKVKGSFSEAFYNNGIVTAKQTFYDKDGNKTGSYYAAFFLDGRAVFDAETSKYTEMTTFVGNYALVKNSLGKMIFIDKNGKEVKDVTSEMYYTSSNSSKVYHYKAGVYVTYSGSGTTRRYGLSTYGGKAIFENTTFTYEVIDKRGTNEVLYYTKNTDGIWNLYYIK